MPQAAKASAVLLIAAGLSGLGAAQGLRPPTEEPPLTVRDNDRKVTVPGDTFQVWLPHNGLLRWEPVASGGDRPKEVPKTRRYRTAREYLQRVAPDRAKGADGDDSQRLGGWEFQASTFTLPPASEGKGPFPLELVYCDGKAPAQAGALYKPAGDDLSKKDNQPQYNMRYRVSVSRK